MKNMNKGYDENTGLYTSRYYAKKAASGDEVVVKVCGGYTIMTATHYNTWKKQK
jgi:diaminopimelate decarboxylase